MHEKLIDSVAIEASDEIARVLDNLPDLKLSSSVPLDLQPTLDHMKASAISAQQRIISQGREVLIKGPDWCRDNASFAGQAHADVIVATYGRTYALPNKNPEENVRALNNNEVDMYLMLEKNTNQAIGTACLVKGDNGWGELGRSASLGHVGNQLIQDLRIIRWLTDTKIASQFHSLFTTLRTAPDRDIGEASLMRGGQAVSAIWTKIPGVYVAGFGPLYKKHGALEQFSFAFLSQKKLSMPNTLWIEKEENVQFVTTWNAVHGFNKGEQNNIIFSNVHRQANIEFAPPESGLTEMVHGDIHLTKDGPYPVEDAIRALASTGVPFMQCPVSIEEDTRLIQGILIDAGFQAFQVTPRIEGVQPAQLWFGKINGNISVVPTFWDNGHKSENPFWNENLSFHARRIANRWNNQTANNG
jgi:hypothetical protein